MKQMLRPSSLVLLFFLSFNVFFTFFCGPIGHVADAWNFIYTGLYTTDFLHPNYIQDYWLLQRPVEYTIQVWFLLKWLGLAFHTQAIHFYALLLLSFAIFFFGRILEKLYSDDPVFIALTMLLMFFYGPSFASTFCLNTSTSLLAAVFFWCMGLCLFKLATARSWFWGVGFALGSLLCYFLSVFSYENFVLAIFVFPCWIYLEKTRAFQGRNSEKNIRVILRSIIPTVGIFAMLLLIKYVFIQFIGRQTALSLLPFLQNLWRYWLALLMYEADAVKEVAASNYRYLAIGIFGILWLLTRKKPSTSEVDQYNPYNPFLIGGVLFFLGSFPYIIAGYNVSLQPIYASGARELSSAVFGFVFMLSGVLLLKKNTLFHRAAKLCILVLLSSHIAFAFILADAWKEATRLQKSLLTSLLEVCPDVDDNTHFIFLDAQTFVGSKASIFGGVLATNVLTQIMYDNLTLRGALAYSGEVTRSEHTMVIGENSLKPRTYGEFYPIDHTIIVKNTDYAFEVVNLRSADQLNAIWPESYFELTRAVLNNLREAGLPEKISRQVKPLKNTIFLDKNAFLNGLKEYLDHEEITAYQDLFLKHAWRADNGITEVRSNTQRIKSNRVENAFTKYLATLPD